MTLQGPKYPPYTLQSNILFIRDQKLGKTNKIKMAMQLEFISPHLLSVGHPLLFSPQNPATLFGQRDHAH